MWTSAILVWLVAVGVGVTLLAGYANAPGAAGQPPHEWPGGDQIALSKTGATLLLFVHPRCPCTRSSLGELEKIVARCPRDIAPWVVVYKPVDSPPDWERTDLWDAAAAIPGAHIVSDPGGNLARRFGVLTSGQTLLYDHDGALVFNGGITFARGHAGDNAGSSAIEAHLLGLAPGHRQTPVFGCPIAKTLYPDQEAR